MLKNENNDWIEDQIVLKAMGVEFFKNLYEKDSSSDKFMVKESRHNCKLD